MKKVFFVLLFVYSFVLLAATPTDTLYPNQTKLTFYKVFFGNENEYQVCYPKDHRNYFIFSIAFAVIASVLGAFIVFIKNKNNKLLKEKNEIIGQKNKDLVDSIIYARRIQQTILPTRSFINSLQIIPYILYKPKDIVSGDFYWIHQSNDKLYLAVCDCTGHGVPGAMVSVVCSNALNRSVKEYNIKETNLILDKTREQVLAAFSDNENNVNDGMDMSLCAIDIKTKKMQWSGANNPVWIIRGKEIIELKPDKQPIGKTENPVNFSLKEMDLVTGDIVYASTDGYADQFGGVHGKKFKYKQLKETILAGAGLNMTEQLKKLDKIFEQWKGNLEQVDDVLIVGIKV